MAPTLPAELGAVAPTTHQPQPVAPHTSVTADVTAVGAGDALRNAQLDQGDVTGVNAPRIVGAARMLRQGPGAPATMTVTLDPASLGRVRVELTSHEGQLAVRLHAEHARSVQAIGAGLDHLRDALESEGLRLTDVGVGLTGSGGQRDLGGSGPDHGGAGARSGSSLGTGIDLGGTEAPVTTTPTRRTVMDDGQVDVDL
ncbi:MAG: flagellar hook-length control protein FliK [Microthrixaceae bacterium]